MKNSNICIAFARRSNAVSACSWVALASSKTALALANAALNSLTTAGTTFSKSLSVTLSATSTAICKASLLAWSSTSIFSSALIASLSASITWSTSCWVASSFSKILWAFIKLVCKFW